MQKRTTHLHRLKNGRTIEYVEYGDPKGIPVFYFHCFMGSCHQAVMADDQAKQKGFRLIAPNRPGIGASSQADFRKMTGYAQDIRELADALKIDTFAVMGASSGGCYALAVAHELPERAKLIGVAGCIGPMDVVQNIQQIPRLRRHLLLICYQYPRVAWFFIAAFFTFCKYFPKLSYNWIIRTSSVLDAKEVQQPFVSRILWWDHQTVLLNSSGIEGLLLEVKLYFNWGFDPANISPKTRVIVWHGTEDPILPWSAIEKISRKIPNSEAILCKGGHLTFLMHHADDMFALFKEEWLRTQHHKIKHEHPIHDVMRAFGDFIRHPFRHTHSA